MTLAEIYAAHFEFVWRSLRRLGVPPAAIEDAVQEVFVVVHRRLSGFEARSSLKTWVFGIARRVARDHRPSWRQRPLEPATLEALPATRAGAPDPAAQVEAAQELAALLEALDEDKREAFMLVDLEELTVPEAAALLGLNINTIYSRVRAARQELAAVMRRRRALESGEAYARARS
jgi:RNA polymerase sigma-70 factor (ECF subfamily)